MSKTAFQEFIEQEKAADSRGKSIDWEERKQYYLSQVEVLYKNVEDYLRDYIGSNDIVIETTRKVIDEEILGKYEVPVLNIHIYGRHATLMPAGTNVFCTPGRVDMVGCGQTIKFFLVDKYEYRKRLFFAVSLTKEQKEQVEEMAQEWIAGKRDYVWKIITDPPDVTFIMLNEDSFLDALQAAFGTRT